MIFSSIDFPKWGTIIEGVLMNDHIVEVAECDVDRYIDWVEKGIMVQGEDLLAALKLAKQTFHRTDADRILEFLVILLSFDRTAPFERMIAETRDLLLAGGHPVTHDNRRSDLSGVKAWKDILRPSKQAAKRRE